MEKIKIDLSKAEKLAVKIVARGEISNHAHVVTGDADVFKLDNELYIKVYTKAFIKHLLETDFVQGNEVWTKEHTDIPLEKGIYKYVGQVEYNPYENLIRSVKD